MKSGMIILGVLNDTDVEWLIQSGQRQHFSPGQVLITQGQSSDWVFLILEGRVGLSRKDLGQIDESRSGELLGEVSFVDSGLPSATATAINPTTALCIAKTHMRERLDHNDGFAARFYRALSLFLALRLRTTQALLDEARTGQKNAATYDQLDLELIEHSELAARRFRDILERLT
jgi:CRP-like cAMP-binding protein